MGRIINPFGGGIVSPSGAPARAGEKKGIPRWSGFIRERLNVEKGAEPMDCYEAWRIFPPGTVLDGEAFAKEIEELFPKRDPDIRWHQVLEFEPATLQMPRHELGRLATRGGAFALERRGDDWKVVAGGKRNVPILALYELGRQAARNPSKVKLFATLRAWIDGPENREAPPEAGKPGLIVEG